MPSKKILITGGVGFVGSFLADKLVNDGYDVRIFDNLEDQVHAGKAPSYINKHVKFIKGDVRDYDSFATEILKADIIFHLAAAVGVQQSQYEIKRFVDVNVGGTSNLLNALANAKHSVEKVVLMSSMTAYGEGMYSCKKCGNVKGTLRSEEKIQKKDWDMYCAICGSIIYPVATDENTSLSGNSVYALTKKYQEEMLMLTGKIYQIPVVSFRGFNIYGPRQSISNPYTGVTAIFISRLKNGNRPVIYEDGKQTRDFISVHDVIDALTATINNSRANYQIMNLGSGVATSIKETAQLLTKLMNKKITPIISGKYRKSDLKNCFADIEKTKKILGWAPQVTLENGLKELCDWAKEAESIDLFDKAENELREKGLL